MYIVEERKEKRREIEWTGKQKESKTKQNSKNNTLPIEIKTFLREKKVWVLLLKPRFMNQKDFIMSDGGWIVDF